MKYSKAVKKIGLCAAVLPFGFLPNQADAQATIVISGTVNIGFGTFTTNGGAGTVVVNNSGVRTVTGSLVTVGGAGLVSQGVFTLTGSTGLAIDLSMTNSTFTVNNGAGGVMNVNGFDLISNGGGINQTVTLSTSTEAYNLGATLNVGASQAPGTYTGSYTLSANYQ